MGGGGTPDSAEHWTEHFARIGPPNGRTRYVVLTNENEPARTQEAKLLCKEGEIVHRVDSRHRCSEKGSST